MNIASKTAEEIAVLHEDVLQDAHFFKKRVTVLVQSAIDQARGADAARIKQLEEEREELTASATAKEE